MNWTPATLRASRNSFPCHTSENSPVSKHPIRMRVPSVHRESRDLIRPVNPLTATLTENHLLTPIIATLPKPPFLTPVFATLPRSPGGYPSNLGTHHSPATPQVLSFHTLAHSFALPKITTSFFSTHSQLFSTNHPALGSPLPTPLS